MPATKTDDQEVVTDPADLPAGGAVYNPEAEQPAEAPVNEPPAQDAKELAIAGTDCPDCEGRGIRNPQFDTQVCPTCEGRGKVL